MYTGSVASKHESGDVMNAAAVGFGCVGTVTTDCVARLGHSASGADIGITEVDEISADKLPRCRSGRLPWGLVR